MLIYYNLNILYCLAINKKYFNNNFTLKLSCQTHIKPKKKKRAIKKRGQEMIEEVGDFTWGNNTHGHSSACACYPWTLSPLLLCFSPSIWALMCLLLLSFSFIILWIERGVLM